MKLNKIEGKAILFLEVIALHSVALLSKIYLWNNKEIKKELILLEDMTGIEPVIFAHMKAGNRFGYLVKGTSILLCPYHKDDKLKMGKYQITVGLDDPPWEKAVPLEYIFDNYPDRVKQHFLFNLTKFN